MKPRTAMIRRALRVLLVLTCALAGSWGSAAGPHATTHSAVGATQPGHHHVPGGHGLQAIDEGTRTSTRRRLTTSGVRLRMRVRAAWVGLVSVARRLVPAVPSTRPGELRHGTVGSLATLCVCRT